MRTLASMRYYHTMFLYDDGTRKIKSKLPIILIKYLKFKFQYQTGGLFKTFFTKHVFNTLMCLVVYHKTICE